MGKRKPSKPVADDEAMDVDTFLASYTAPDGIGARELADMRGIGSVGVMLAWTYETALLREYDRLVKLLGGESATEAAVVTKTGLQPSEFWKLPKVDRVRYLRLAAGKKVGPIPPECKTKPLTYRKAAKLMGKGDTQDAAEWLSAQVRAGAIQAENINRQSHIFNRLDFPAEAQSKLTPNST